MTLTFSSLEEAWGGKSVQTLSQSQKNTRAPGNLLTNVSDNTKSSVHSATFQTPGKHTPLPNSKRVSTDKYENIYCNTIINHVQGCTYCQERLRSIFNWKEPSPMTTTECSMSPDVLKRQHDNLAYVPFGLEPEVFNILLFSSILISLIFLIDKKGMKSFKF